MAPGLPRSSCHRIFAAVVLATMLVTTTGCDRFHPLGEMTDGGASLTTLTVTDVLGLTPGNATGQGFAGAFTIRSAHLDACRCRSGLCASIKVQTGFTREAAQHDGGLTLDPGGGNACIGGVDADGTFWCGYSWVRGGGSELSRQRGNFTVKNGAPTTLHVVAELTWAIPGTQPVDCDLQTTTELDYVGPATSL